QYEMPNYIQQLRRAQQSSHQALLLGKLSLAERGRGVGLRALAVGPNHRLPGAVVMEGSAQAAHARLVKAAGNEQLIGVEQRLVPLVVIHLAASATLVGVAAKLIDRLGQRLRHAGAFALNHDKRNAVHEQYEV